MTDQTVEIAAVKTRIAFTEPQALIVKDSQEQDVTVYRSWLLVSTPMGTFQFAVDAKTLGDISVLAGERAIKMRMMSGELQPLPATNGRRTRKKAPHSP